MASPARQRLLEAETVDQYQTRCSQCSMNEAARQGNIYEPASVKGFLAARMNTLMNDIQLLDDSSIVVLHPTADNGYPHTRPGNLVCMPTVACEGEETDVKRTLCHESYHIHQRNHPEQWKAFLEKEGWKQQMRAMVPESLQRQCRINPDTLTAPFWSWQTHYIPLPLFVNKPALTLGDISIKWYDIRKGGALFGEAPPSFYIKYGLNVTQPEHPYEVYAVKFADDGIVDERGLVAAFSR